MIKKQLRIQSIAEDIATLSNYSIRDLASKYNISEMTVRRDIKYIEDNHLLSFAVQHEKSGNPHSSGVPVYEFNSEKIKMADEKKRIAAHAASMIEPNDVLLLDTGTTVDLLCQLLPENTPLTVICYNYNVASHLFNSKDIKLVLAGGYYHPISRSFESKENVEFLKSLRAKKMFVSVSGVEKLGLTCSSQYEVITKQTAIASSKQKILLTDSSKFGVIKSSYFASLETMDLIITDTGLSQEWIDYIQSRGIALQLV